MKYRLGACALVLALAACSRGDGVAESGSANGNAARQPVGLLMKQARPVARVSIASAPDRGALISYPDHGKPARREGAHTWYQATISEAHAFNAIASGEMTLPLPDGSELKLEHERHPEGSDGNWTWIGRVEGGDPGQEAIITFGDDAVYGSIPQADGKPPLEIRTQGGSLWVVQADPSLLKKPNIGDRDMKLPPSGSTRQSAAAQESGRLLASAAPMVAAAAANATVDVVIGYSSGFRSAKGGQSQAVTRLNFLIEVGNQAYSNSGVNGQLRLVNTVEVSYADNTDNETALEELTGNSGSGSISVPAALKPIRDAREQYGADIAILVRKFQTPENDGCGIAWLNGGNGTTIDPSLDDDFGFGVVSDGSDAGTDGKTYFCADETLVHEASHLMGSAHDVDNAGGTQGAFAYSYGYKTSASNGNFYTVMAYGDSGQTSYRVFSNPGITFCGGKACGVADKSDNARSLNQTMPLVASFRQSIGTQGKATFDFNGDGKSDIFWREASQGRNAIWNSGNSNTQPSVVRVGALSWAVVAVGDYDGDGRDDIVWRNGTDGRNTIWLSGNAGTERDVTRVGKLSWQVKGSGDFDGDGKSDLVWRDSASGRNAIWLSGKDSTQKSITAVTKTSWQIVGVGDFNGDGVSDVLWREASSTRNAIWLSGNSATQKSIANMSASYSVAGIADYDGDGISDILWRSTSGQNVIWLSGSNSSQLSVGSLSTTWKAVQSADFDGDGKADILWRNSSTGQNVVWHGASNSQTESLSTVASQTWKVMPL